MRRQRVLTILLAVALLGGALYIVINRRAQVSADDLAAALGVKWWHLEVPAHEEGAILGLEVVRASGKTHSGGSTWTTGSAKLFLWEVDDMFRWSIIGEGTIVSGELKNPLESENLVTAFQSSGSTIRVGEFALVVGDKTASLPATDAMPEGQVGFRVVFRKS